MGEIIKDLDKDQHFLVNINILNEEIKIAKISSKDKIIEIGAGKGNLTKELIKKAKKVLAFEIDKRYKKTLDPLKSKNLIIIYGNALDYSWKGYNKIVSNIPYSLSEPIINKCIHEEIIEIILIVGKKFKDLLENSETKIGVLANLFYNVKFIEKINPSSFSPPPRVNSWLIKLNKKKYHSPEESFLISVLERKGKIKNVLLWALVEKGKTKREARKIIDSFDLNVQVLEKSIDKATPGLIKFLKKKYLEID